MQRAAPLTFELLESGLKPTQDLEAVKRIARHPEIFGAISDDDNQLYLHLHERIFYFLIQVSEPVDEVYVKPVVAGFVSFTPVNACTWIPHVAVLPEFRDYGLATKSLKEGISWMFKNTACQKLVGRPPVYNQAMLRIFEKCGFVGEGVSPKSWLRYGKLFDRIYVGLEKDRCR